MVLFVTIYLALGAKYRIKNKVVNRISLCAYLQSSRKFWSKNERGEWLSRTISLDTCDKFEEMARGENWEGVFILSSFRFPFARARNLLPFHPGEGVEGVANP